MPAATSTTKIKSACPKQPSLAFYPVDFDAWASSPPMVHGDSGGSCAASGALVAACIIIAVLVVFAVAAVAVWWGVSLTAASEQKQVRFAEPLVKHDRKLIECKEDMLKRIMDAKYPDPVVLAFVSPNCGFCTAMKPALQAAATKSSCPIMTVTFVDAKRSPLITQTLTHLNIRGFPTIVRIEEGKAHVYRGDRSEADVVRFAS